MKAKFLRLYKIPLLLAAILFCFVLSGCNESGNIWAKYCSESFCATVRYEQNGSAVCAKVSVVRAERDEITVEFSSPDALRGVVGYFDGSDFRLTCEDIEISGEPAAKLMHIPALLAARDAISFEKPTEDGRRLLSAETEGGKIVFDADTGKPIRAELDGTACEIITFAWKDRLT